MDELKVDKEHVILSEDTASEIEPTSTKVTSQKKIVVSCLVGVLIIFFIITTIFFLHSPHKELPQNSISSRITPQVISGKVQPSPIPTGAPHLVVNKPSLDLSQAEVATSD